MAERRVTTSMSEYVLNLVARFQEEYTGTFEGPTALLHRRPHRLRSETSQVYSRQRLPHTSPLVSVRAWYAGQTYR